MRTQERASRVLRAVLNVGIVFAAAAALNVVALVVGLSRIVTVLPYDDTVVVPEGFAGLSPTETSDLGLVIALPAGLLLVAACLITTGRVLRGGLRVSGTDDVGSLTSHNEILPLRWHLFWIAVAVGVWVLLVVVPLLSSLAGGWPLTVDEEPRGYLWATLGLYGGTAAAMAGTLIASYFKKTWFLALEAKADPRLDAKDRVSGFWRWFTYRWRLDLWCAAIGTGVAGVFVLTLMDGDYATALLGAAGGLALFAVGIVTGRQYWRAGVPLGVGESVL